MFSTWKPFWIVSVAKLQKCPVLKNWFSILIAVWISMYCEPARLIHHFMKYKIILWDKTIRIYFSCILNSYHGLLGLQFTYSDSKIDQLGFGKIIFQNWLWLTVFKILKFLHLGLKRRRGVYRSSNNNSLYIVVLKCGSHFIIFTVMNF